MMIIKRDGWEGKVMMKRESQSHLQHGRAEHVQRAKTRALACLRVPGPQLREGGSGHKVTVSGASPYE